MDLTFSELPVDRNPLKVEPTSETWEQGTVVSRAEQTRNRLPNVTISQAAAVTAAAKARGSEGYDAGHWYFQPVGGRNVRAAPHKQGHCQRQRTGSAEPNFLLPGCSARTGGLDAGGGGQRRAKGRQRRGSPAPPRPP